jgi:hypothetical protein
VEAVEAVEEVAVEEVEVEEVEDSSQVAVYQAVVDK